jgi:transcriptional accessory protein Tex/SPT6
MSDVSTTQRLALTDLEAKMKFQGTVTRVELFGVFVDIGAERDGLVHVSQVGQSQTGRLTDLLEEGSEVTVWVQSVELDQGRISLTMIEPPERTIDELKSDQIVTGTVTKLAPYGAFVDIGVGRDGLIHISEMSDGHIERPSEVAAVGAEIEVRVVKVDRRRQRIELSLLGIPGEDEQMPAGEEEAEPLTAMELAWRDAMEREGMSLQVPIRRKGRRRGKAEIRRQQASIIARTLKAQE